MAVGVLLVVVAAVGFELARSSGLLEDAQRSDAEQLAWTVAIAAPLAVRRRYPVAVALVSAARSSGSGSATRSSRCS